MLTTTSSFAEIFEIGEWLFLKLRGEKKGLVKRIPLFQITIPKFEMIIPKFQMIVPKFQKIYPFQITVPQF